MISKRYSLVLAAVAAVATLFTRSATPEPAGTNAALRYWMAFALMDNPAAGSEVANRLEKVAGGQEPWDESLAPIVDRNREALETMRRGAQVRDCDWGLEEDLGPEVPIAHVARARSLARLNVLDGMRRAQQGRSEQAVEAWLAGIRFSRQLASDRLWISALVAGRSLKSHLQALHATVAAGRLDDGSLDRIARALSDLPEDGFDWGLAPQHEMDGIVRLLASGERAADPLAWYETYFPLTPEEKKAGAEAQARRLGLTAAQLANPSSVQGVFRQARERAQSLRPAVLAAFKQRPGEADALVREVDAQAAQDPVLSRAWPSAVRFNEARAELAREREALRDLLRRRGRGN
jgi:hypothetical protein